MTWSIELNVKVHIRVVSYGLVYVLDWLFYVSYSWKSLWTGNWWNRVHFCLYTLPHRLLYIHWLLSCCVTEILWQLKQWLSLLCNYWDYRLLICGKWCFCLSVYAAVVHCVIVLFWVYVNMILDVWSLAIFYRLMIYWTCQVHFYAWNCLKILAFLYRKLFKYILFVLDRHVWHNFCLLWELIYRKRNNFLWSWVVSVWWSQSNFCDWCFVIWTDWVRIVDNSSGPHRLLDSNCCRPESLCYEWSFLLWNFVFTLRRHFNLDRLFLMKLLKEYPPIADVWCK